MVTKTYTDNERGRRQLVDVTRQEIGIAMCSAVRRRLTLLAASSPQSAGG